jgi:hypothetical protein
MTFNGHFVAWGMARDRTTNYENNSEGEAVFRKIKEYKLFIMKLD